jgi:hypothetical protein
MRDPLRFLAYLLLLTACTAPVQPASTELATPGSQAAPIDGTFKTSVLAAIWRDGPKGSLLFPLDPATGDPVPGYEPILLVYSSPQAFSPDRKTLAVITFSKDDSYYHNSGRLLLIDLPAWESRHLDLKLDGWISSMVFSPDGKRLAIAHGETSYYYLTIVNVEQGNILAKAPMDFLVTRLKFTEDGESLMIYRPGILPVSDLSPGPAGVLLLDVAKLNTRWSAELDGVRDGMFPRDETITQSQLYEPGKAIYFTPALTFAPNRNTLYIVHADSEQLTTVDFDAQMVKTVSIKPKLTRFEWLLSLTAGVAHAKFMNGTNKQAVISPDGRLLYVVGTSVRSVQNEQGNFQTEQTPLGLEIIQPRDGSRVQHFDTDATELFASPDGHYLYLRNGVDAIPWTEIFDTNNRQLVARKGAFYATPAMLMNGQFLLASTYVSPETNYQEQYQMSVLQPSDLSVLADWKGPDFIYWITP